uniref:Serpin B9 n=1 Tax=Anoplophora glabripennis TaxID=217634 RepID=V5I8H6_ANOGL
MKCVLLLTLLYGVLGVPVEDEALQEFVAGNHKFTAAVYKELSKKQQGNFIVSPLSAEVVLALTNEGARGETAAELAAGLSLPNTKEKTQRAIKSILPNLQRSDEHLKLLSANKIYTDIELKLEPTSRQSRQQFMNQVLRASTSLKRTKRHLQLTIG